MTELDLSRPKTVHLVGIGGAGMSGLARILLQRGHRVTGTDMKDSGTLEELRALGADVQVGHDEAAVTDVAAVVASSAVRESNPELVVARERGLPVLRRAELLDALMAQDRRILIAGTHGKTTTTSMTVMAMQGAGIDPSFAIGGNLNEAGTNAHAGGTATFVAEADESDRSLLVYRPHVAVVTNAELDHPDEYGSDEEVAEVFREFLDRREPDGLAVLCLDDPGSAALRDRVDGPVITYGASPGADVRLVTADGEPSIRFEGDEICRLRLLVPGHHNLLNATAAVAICVHEKLDPVAAAAGLETFSGAARRFQILGEQDGVLVVDDYAHHPTELRATVQAARTRNPARLIVVVQPHRFSRTARFGEELGQAAADADVVVVSDVYAASEDPIPGVTGELVADAARRAGAHVLWQPHLGEVVDQLAELVDDGDLVLVTGAGDVTQVGPALLARLAER